MELFHHARHRKSATHKVLSWRDQNHLPRYEVMGLGLAINALSTESQKKEQSGFANLVKGTFGMFRNTTAHEARILWPMGKADAEDLLWMCCNFGGYGW